MAIRKKGSSFFIKKPHTTLLTMFALVILVSLACSASGAAEELLQPEETKEQLFKGITYVREVRSSPRPMVIHVVTIDLKANGIKVLVTPGDPNNDKPLKARTTSDFLEENDLQLAINGDGFKPWHDFGPLGYAPKSGENVAPVGYAASKGIVYSDDTDSEPTLYIYKNNKASINNLIGKVHNAISGNRLLVQRGDVVEGLGNKTNPRTAAGLNRAGRKLIIVVVDGRQPGYSEGVSLTELAEILLDYGAYTAINLDGGGSTTLVVQDKNGSPDILNSPVHQGIPGNERPVGNHLGIFANN